MVCPLHAFLERKQIPPPADNRRKKNYMEKPTVKKIYIYQKTTIKCSKRGTEQFCEKTQKKKITFISPS
jgi:hypothetical protein